MAEARSQSSASQAQPLCISYQRLYSCRLCQTPVSCLQDYIGTLPAVDRAEAFGQHPNADIAYQIEDSWLVLESLLSLQPQTALAAGGRSREDIVGAICADLLEQVPAFTH